ncbi:hypothetical protein [Streptomyces litmocidini]|uniref:hypothetical protein n=1 Tax=Streptomyces litmocidini TaxID=67318 RepID=UPI003F53F155
MTLPALMLGGRNAGHVPVPPPPVVIGSLVPVVPLLIAFLALQWFWRAGMTAGSIK